jgi:predicted MFS family arabinose efflux permease
MTTRELMRQPGFRPLCVTYGLSEIGDWLTTIALAVLVYDATGSAAATTILFLASKFVPAFIAPAVTARVDTISPRRTLPVLFAVQGAAFVGMALISRDVSAVVGLAAVAGAAALVSRSLVRASVAASLPDPEDLRKGNAILNVVFSVAFAAGPAIAGGAVAGLATTTTLLVGAALLVWMGLYAAVSPLSRLEVSEDEADAGWWTKLRTGVDHLRNEPLISRLFAAQALLLVFFTMVPPIEVVYAREELGTTAAGLGALMAAWGIGAVAGSAVFARYGKVGTVPLAVTATAAMGASYFGMGLAGTLPLACALSVVGGLGNGIQWIAFVTTVQERVPGELQARAMSLVESLGAAVPGLGFALGGAVAAAASARVAYVMAGGGILFIVAFALVATAIARTVTASQRTTMASTA